MGPPGCQKMENARTLADTLGWKSIHPGQLMRNEVDKKTEIRGRWCADCLKESSDLPQLLTAVGDVEGGAFPAGTLRARRRKKMICSA